MADVVERLPFPISKKLASTVTEVVSRNGREIHYTIAGVPFRLATSPDMPATWETAQFQKDQQDQEPEAGEQTLSGWWIRSQVSWFQGAGALFSEAQGDVTATASFRTSSNVDVWTPGELSLLKATIPIATASVRSVALVPTSTAQSAIVGRVGSVTRYTNLDAGTAATTLYTDGAVTFTHVLATETQWFAAGNDGKVYGGLLSGGAPTTWTLTGADTTKATRIAWAKHRLFAVNGNKIYEVVYGTPGATAAIYTHPTTGWIYSDVCDGPGGILFAGYGDGTSGLHRITLDTDGGIPTLSGATTVVQLPTDEKVLRVSGLAGSLFCMVTNMGVRVAVADGNGALTYGPLFLERDTEVPDGSTPAICSAGRFWWLSFGDENKLWRVDSSTEVEQGVFAYASDMETASPPQSVTVRRGRAVVSTVSGAVAYQHATQLCATGYLQTGRIRFRTDEYKTYHYIDVTAAPLQGSVTLETLNDADSSAPIITWSTPGQSLPSAQFPATYGTQRFVSLKFTLQPDVGLTTGPTLYGVRVRALPAAAPQRIYTLPLQCYDSELWSTGQMEGYDGFARDRYLSVRAAEDAGGVVLLVNYQFPEPSGELCRIDGIKFVQLQQPDDRQIDGGMGGILIVTLRTLT